MLFKSKNLNGVSHWLSEPWTLSSLLHGVLVILALILFIGAPSRKEKSLDIEVIESPQLAPQPLQITTPKEPSKKTRGHEVYGLSRKSITSTQGEQVKAGNTIAKTPDSEKLKPQDQDSLPIPSEDYLVTQMPVLKSEVRIPYPPEPKKKGIQGAVMMDLLIDSQGKVREALLIEGPDPDLNAAAVSAAKGFQFTSAFIQDQAVAVRIRYAYHFVLEH